MPQDMNETLTSPAPAPAAHAAGRSGASLRDKAALLTQGNAIFVGMLVIAGGVLWYLGRPKTPEKSSAETQTAELRVNAALTQIGVGEDKAGQTDVNALASAFYEQAKDRQVPPEHLATNPFKHTPTLAPPSGTRAKLMRYQRSLRAGHALAGSDVTAEDVDTATMQVPRDAVNAEHADSLAGRPLRRDVKKGALVRQADLGPSQGQAKPKAPPVDHLRLRTVLIGRKANSAMIATGKAAPEIVTQGQTIAGWRVKSIEQGKVVLTYQGQTHELVLPE